MKKTKINLVDKYLFVIMIVLLLFNMSTIFIEVKRNFVTAQIDIAMRTAVASIFGYFISSNFAKQVPHKINNYNVSTSTVQNITSTSNNNDTNNDKIINKIGFNLQDDANSTIQDNSTIDKENDSIDHIDLNSDYLANKKDDVQVTIIFYISMFSILFFFIIRNFSLVENIDASLISQFRDIICGSIGFLIGIPVKELNSNKAKLV